MAADSSDLPNTSPRTVAYNDQAFTIDGRPEIFLSACIHYFHVPRELWADRIAKAKRGGMNTIETHVARSVHEEIPGMFDREGDRDLGAFFTECERQAMYVIVRPGPYIDAGASIIADHQWTRGGNVVLVRVDDDHQHQVRDGLLQGGIEVPLISDDPGDQTPYLRDVLAESPEGIEYESWRRWAEGARGYNYDALISETGRLTDKWRACRRVAMFARTFKEILLTGKVARDLKSGRGGLRLSETGTRQNGSILWIDNPDENATVTGSVFPYLPEITLGPRTIFPYVHDAPIGAGANYLGSYAGLVKSDATVLTAHILSDPHDGVRVYVYGTPGETREVALWSGNEKGHGVDVTFAADTPTLYTAGMSRIVALPTSLAGRVWIHQDDDNAPVLIGPDDVREHRTEDAVVELRPGRTHTVFALRPDGAVTEIDVDAPALPPTPALGAWKAVGEPDCTAVNFDDSTWREIEDISRDENRIALGNGSKSYGWYRARIHLPDGDGGDAQIRFAACSDRLTLYVNGERIGAPAIPPEDDKTDWAANFDIRLRDGDNVLCVLADGLGLIHGPITITPSGNCYLVDVARWRFQGGLYGERHGWIRGLPPGSASDGPIRWFQTTFTLDAALDTATPLLVRPDGMGKGVLWLNGRNLGRYRQTVGAKRDYYAPEPWLNVGENVLILVETEGNTPNQVSLVWDDLAAIVTRIAL